MAMVVFATGSCCAEELEEVQLATLYPLDTAPTKQVHTTHPMLLLYALTVQRQRWRREIAAVKFFL